MLDLNTLGLTDDELNTLGFVMSQVPEVGKVIKKLSSTEESGNIVEGEGGPKEDNVPIMASAGEYVIPVEVVEALGVDYFDELVNETKTAINGRGSAVTQPNDVPAQQQGETKKE